MSSLGVVVYLTVNNLKSWLKKCFLLSLDSAFVITSWDMSILFWSKSEIMRLTYLQVISR